MTRFFSVRDTFSTTGNSCRTSHDPMKRFLSILLLTACTHITESRFVRGPQGKLHVEDGGSGAGIPVIFVHGNGANLTQWRAQLDHVRKSRRAVAFDLRGMGESDPAVNGDYSVAAMTDDVRAVAEALRVRRFVLVGHSYGGAVVASFAAKYPDRVAGVVFADAAGNVKVPAEEAQRFLAALRANKHDFARQWFAPILKNASDDVKGAVFGSVDRTPADAFAGALEGQLDFDVAKALASYAGPKLAIAASDIESPSSLHVQFPTVPTKKIAGVSHWLMMDKPDDFNRLLDEFLDALDSTK